MNSNEILISKFYTCFQDKNFRGMQDCYAGNAQFTDPVFSNLNAEQVKAMWEMFCVKGKDLEIEYKNVGANGNIANAEWVAFYTFSATGKKVVNHIKSHFVLDGDKIVMHTDHFNFYAWSKQALGLPGLLLGWTPYLKNKVRKTAMKNLNNFMKK